MKARNNLNQAASSVSVGFLLAILFDPEDGGNMFICNIRISTDYMVLQSRRLYSL
jgi:hypothetical protein